MRLFIYVCILVVLPTTSAFAATTADAQVQGIYKFLKQGDADMAVSTAHALLKNPKLGKNKRFELLQALAKAEATRAELDGYHHVEKAVQAYKTLIKHYPSKVDIAALQWRVASLYWKARNLEKADAAAQTIMQDYKSSPKIKQATLLRARIMIEKSKFSDARFLLLEYFGLGSAAGSRDEAEGIAWMSVVDFSDGHRDQAWINMQKAYAMAPDLIKKDSTLYATYVQLLAQNQGGKKALNQATDYVNRFISSPEAPVIRLLQADLLEKQGRLTDAKELYGILANSYANSSVGKKAQIRRLMLIVRNTTHPSPLLATVQKLDKVAATNQLSDVEAEARFDQARLLARLGKTDQKQDDHAIAYYAIAAASEQQDIAPVATKEGTQLLSKRLDDLLVKHEWLQAALLWKRYPQLRSENDDHLAFEIAKAYTRLQDFSDAEPLYRKLYTKAEGSLQSQRIMLAMARLWLQRGDSDGIRKISHWLSVHSNALFHQEMLLTMAQMQLSQGSVPAAIKIMNGISPGALLSQLVPAYWHTEAMISVDTKHWQRAAHAWRKLTLLSHGNARWRHMHAQAHALMENGNYTNAGKVLNAIPKANRNAAWSFAMATCNQHTGHWDDAAEQLQQLAQASPANGFTLRAQMILANHQAGQVEEELQ